MNNIDEIYSRDQLTFLISRIDELFSPRIINALSQLKFKYVYEVLGEDFYKLLTLKNFNKKSAQEILDKAKNYNLNFGLDITPFFNSSIKELREVYKVKPLNINNVSDEIENLIKSIKNERNIKIFKMRLGFDKFKVSTLEEVGLKYNMTRERVRQIERKIFLNLKKNNFSSFYINQIHEFLSTYSPINEIEANEYLQNKNFIVPLNTLIKLFELFHLDSKLSVFNFQYSRFNSKKISYISLDDHNKDLQKITKYISKEISSSGICSVKNMIRELNSSLNEKFIKSIITKYVVWLDDDWFYFKTVRNRLYNLIAKAFHNTDKINLDLLYDGIKRNVRYERDISKDTLRVFCSKILNLEIINNEIYSNELINNYSSNYKSEQHDKILSIFEYYGPVLEIDDLYEMAEIHDIKKVTLYANLMWSPKFVKVDRAVYALINFGDFSVADDFLKIELNSLTFDKSEAIPVKSNGVQYKVQLLKNGEHYKFTENPRPLRMINSSTTNGYGIVYKNKVYKVLNPEIIKNDK